MSENTTNSFMAHPIILEIIISNVTKSWVDRDWYLLFEVVQVIPVGFVHLSRVTHNGIWVSLRVACHCDTKVLAIVVPAHPDAHLV